MTSPTIEQLISDVESHAGRRMVRRIDVAALLEAGVHNPEARSAMLFHSKFVTKAFEVIRRTGAGSEEVRNLSAELGRSMEAISESIASLLPYTAPDTRGRITNTYLALNQQALDALSELCSELTWVKNYELDHPPGNERSRMGS